MEQALTDFQSISLAEVNSIKTSVSLLDRYDTKFVFSRDRLFALLASMAPCYRVLQIKDKRVFRYESLYFDTDDLSFYIQHHNQRPNRYKVRYRRYLDTGSCYFELKRKTNKGKTIKSRVKQDAIKTQITGFMTNFIKDNLPKDNSLDIDSIKPKLWSSFSRVTLVNVDINERVTIDLNLSFRTIASPQHSLDQVVIAEVKQKKLSFSSPFMQATRNLRVSPVRFSKYCTGTSLLNSSVKANRFKPRILKICKLNGGSPE